ncbi:MAG: plasmid recombination protein, partial [Clostridia bacterium]|nr:plasmid recombination protein [Clostridia bacterium]
MGVTISTHNGSAVSREHNIRNPKVVSKEPHIDMNGSHEVWIDEPVRKAYDRLFGEAVEAYNAKQARPERQIKSYYNDICKDSKKHPVYEMIIGIYGKNEDGSPICSAEQGKEIMRQFVDNWQERNPNLELIGAYFHADEPGAEPHVHLDYIPVAHGYTRGLETQTGLVKALGEQGFEKKGKATAQIQWEKCENDYLTSLCEAVGLRVEHPRQEGRQHLATQEMKLQSRINELEKV